MTLPRPSPMVEVGPYRVGDIREESPYELSNGHRIECMSSGPRHARTNLQGGKVLDSDPDAPSAGVDPGYTFGDAHLRAPDVGVGGLPDASGFSTEVPPLIVEYADVGQDERELARKVDEFQTAGTRYIWVVRLTGPLRVQVYELDDRGRRLKPRLVAGDGTLTAPGVLRNPVPVKALVDRDAANAATLRNLLNRVGYESLESLEVQKFEEGREEGRETELRGAVVDMCELLGVAMDPNRQAALDAMRAPALRELKATLKATRAWPG